MYRNKKLLALVRQLPCAYCGAGPPSEAAHSNRLEHGKGRSLKASDAAIISACRNCHNELDNGNQYSESELERLTYVGIARTYINLIETGLLIP